MPFPDAMISNWVQHQLVQEACVRCGRTFPTHADGTLYTKKAIVFTGTPTTKWLVCHP